MKVILSKKGFDQGSAGFPNPILEDGSMISLPIPVTDHKEDHRIRYSEIQYGKNKKLIELLERMGIKKIKGTSLRQLSAHLDPDLRQESYPHKPGWRGVFGINGNCQTHIENNGNVSQGDIFLFFGWFEKYRHDGTCKLVNVENRKDYRTGRHAIFGYLQIDTILPLWNMKDSDTRIESWMEYHPHIGKDRKIVGNSYFGKNTLYVARKSLDFAPEKPGFGLFRHDDDTAGHITLTKRGCTRTQWALPPAFTTPKQVKISGNPDGWKTWKQKRYFQSVRTYGQEFVIEESVEVEKWAQSLVRDYA